MTGTPEGVGPVIPRDYGEISVQPAWAQRREVIGGIRRPVLSLRWARPEIG